MHLSFFPLSLSPLWCAHVCFILVNEKGTFKRVCNQTLFFFFLSVPLFCPCSIHTTRCGIHATCFLKKTDQKERVTIKTTRSMTLRQWWQCILAAVVVLESARMSEASIFWKQRSDGALVWDIVPTLERAYPEASARARHAKVVWMPLVKHVRASYVRRMGAYAAWPPEATHILAEHGGLLPWSLAEAPLPSLSHCTITWHHATQPFLWGLVDDAEVCWDRNVTSAGAWSIVVANPSWTLTRHAVIAHDALVSDAATGWNVAWPSTRPCLHPVRLAASSDTLALCAITKGGAPPSTLYAVACHRDRRTTVPEAWQRDGIVATWDDRDHRIVAPEDIAWDPDATRRAAVCSAAVDDDATMASGENATWTVVWGRAREHVTSRARIDHAQRLLFQSDSDGVDGWRLALSIAITLIVAARLFHPAYDLLPWTRRVRIHRTYLVVDDLALGVGLIALVSYWATAGAHSAHRDAWWGTLAWLVWMTAVTSRILLGEAAFRHTGMFYVEYVVARTYVPWCRGRQRARATMHRLGARYVAGAWAYLHRWAVTVVLVAATLWGVLQWSTTTLMEECVIAIILVLYHTYALYALTWAAQRFGWRPRLVWAAHIGWTVRDTIVWILPCLRTVNVVYDDADVQGVFLCLWAAIFALILPPAMSPLNATRTNDGTTRYTLVQGRAFLDDVWQ